jgi:hypothetical protein
VTAATGAGQVDAAGARRHGDRLPRSRRDVQEEAGLDDPAICAESLCQQ